VPDSGTSTRTMPPSLNAVSTYAVGVPPIPGVHDSPTVRPLTVGGLSVGAPGAEGPAIVSETSLVAALEPPAFSATTRTY
jgi:hypothetical protein